MPAHPAFDNRVTRDLGVDIPIVQAPMGWIARSRLASAVSAAGACGIIETSSGELDAVREEIRAIETGSSDPQDNPLKRAPHTLAAVTADHWDRPYSRQQAAFPMEGQQESKVWPAVARIDNAFGDRNLVCTCPSVEAVAVAA